MQDARYRMQDARYRMQDIGIPGSPGGDPAEVGAGFRVDAFLRGVLAGGEDEERIRWGRGKKLFFL